MCVVVRTERERLFHKVLKTADASFALARHARDSGTIGDPSMADLPTEATHANDPPADLLSMLDELFLATVRQLLAQEPLAFFRLRQTCKLLHEKTKAIYSDVEARRLQWIPALTYKCSTSMHGRKCVLGTRWDDDFFSGRECLDPAWAAGPPLPDNASWDVRVDFSDGFGEILIGVCTDAGHDGWGLYLGTGQIFRWGMAMDGYASSLAVCPNGFPDGDGTRVMQFPDLYGKADGAIITCIMNNGTLSFRVNGGPTLHGLSGFPTGVPMRPWAKMRFNGDEITLSPFWSTFTIT